MTLDEIIAKLPPEFKPLAIQYAPIFMQWGQADVLAWIQLIAQGNITEAYGQIVKAGSTADLINQWNALNTEWVSANLTNSQRYAVIREAEAALLRILLTIAVAAVGL
jgi:hypothetical protein